MTTLTIDRDIRRVVVTVPPHTRWGAFHVIVREAICHSSCLAEYHWIIDDRGPMDDVDVDEMARTGEVFRTHTSPSADKPVTIVITTDPSFSLWAKVIDEHYGGRRHYAAPTLDAAERLLDGLDCRHAVN
ncbi:MAG: hypothetical protein EOO83_00245 [Oxalobacteraceae bacterium]|nr:MAG: hypothetical protein EOO83_00245 [Oxalobacteraceae bacterium]